VSAKVRAIARAGIRAHCGQQVDVLRDGLDNGRPVVPHGVCDSGCLVGVTTSHLEEVFRDAGIVLVVISQ